MPSSFAHDPYAAIAELAKLNVKITRGANQLSAIKDEDIQIATTPKEEVFRQDKTTLYHYKPLLEQCSVNVPVLVIYGLIGRYTMADLQEDRSLIRNLLNLGVDVYAVDWGNPSRAERWLTLDDYVDGYIRECVDVIRERHNIDKVNILGICEGGVFSISYAALYPEISPANSFRVIINNFFGTEFELVEDRSFFSSTASPYDFIEVPLD